MQLVGAHEDLREFRVPVKAVHPARGHVAGSAMNLTASPVMLIATSEAATLGMLASMSWSSSHYPDVGIIDFVHVLEYCWKSSMVVLRARRPRCRGVGRRPRHPDPARQGRRGRRWDPPPRHHLRLQGQRTRRRRRIRGLPHCQGTLPELRRRPGERLADRNDVIEGACRYLAADRIGITGARWGLDAPRPSSAPRRHRQR